LPKTRDGLQALPGIGQYVASAVLVYVYGRPAPLLDTNMARVLERFFGDRQLADIRYDPYLQELAQAVVDGNDAKSVNWAVLDLAATVCRLRAPRCIECPLATRCLFAKEARSAA